jgi:alkylation response protein AidB-like acyl-CoA dehydrogenase
MGPEQEHEFRKWIRQGLDKVAPLSFARAMVESGSRPDALLWSGLADLGVLGFGVEERHGGAGASPSELALFLMEAGRVLLPGGFLGGSVVAPRLLHGDPFAASLLTDVAHGRSKVAFADNAVVLFRGSREAPELTGTLSHVADADVCDHLLLVSPDDEVYLVRSTDATLDRRPSLDETRPVSDVVLDRTPARRIAADADDAAQARGIHSLALAAENVGAMGHLLEMTVAHVKARTQFGGPIGRFQAVKHRCADMFVSVQASTSMVLEAFARVESTGRVDPLTALATGSFVADAFVSVAKAAIQLHGGIAFTWEHDVHLFLKRARSNQSLAGGSDRRAAALAASLMSSGESVLVMLGLEESTRPH